MSLNVPRSPRKSAEYIKVPVVYSPLPNISSQCFCKSFGVGQRVSGFCITYHFLSLHTDSVEIIILPVNYLDVLRILTCIIKDTTTRIRG